MKNLVHIFWLIRPVNLFFIALSAYAIRFWLLTPFLDRFSLHFESTPAQFVLLVASFVCIAAAGNAINDYFDNKADLLNRPHNSIINVHLDRRIAMWVHQVLTAMGLIFAVYYAYITGNLLLLSFHAFAVVSLWYYSYEFKTRLFIGNLVVATLTAFVPFATGLFEVIPVLRTQSDVIISSFNGINVDPNFFGSLILAWLICVSGFAFFSNFIREIVKDLQDERGDRSIGRKTIPIVWGADKTRWLVSILLLCLLGSIWAIEYIFLENTFSKNYFILAFTVPTFVVLYFVYKKNYGWASNGIKIMMLLGVVYLFFIEKEFV